MIDVDQVLREVPHFDTFCSIEKLYALVEELRSDKRFTVKVAGTSVRGVPIYHVKFGSGSVKVFFLAGPHANEVIGGLTVYSLMTLLKQANRALLDADVEWHIVPCIDPDGAVLNEGWSLKPFTVGTYMRSYYVQPPEDQVDMSFPIRHGKLRFNRASSREAGILRVILDQVRPDFFYTLHNSYMGGTWYALSRSLDAACYGSLRKLLEQYGVTLQVNAPTGRFAEQFGDGMSEIPSIKHHYSYLDERHSAEELSDWPVGASSYDYLEEIKPDAVTFCAELVYLKHPSDVSDRDTGQDLRQIKLRIDADNKLLAAQILQEWDRVQGDLNPSSPFFRKIMIDLVTIRDKIHVDVQMWSGQQTRDLLFNPVDAKRATESERFSALVWSRFIFLCSGYSFVRLLRDSKQTPAVREAVDRMERIFSEALEDLSGVVDFNAFEVIDCDTLAKVQLGSGLIAINSLLAARRKAA